MRNNSRDRNRDQRQRPHSTRQWCSYLRYINLEKRSVEKDRGQCIRRNRELLGKIRVPSFPLSRIVRLDPQTAVEKTRRDPKSRKEWSDTYRKRVEGSQNVYDFWSQQKVGRDGQKGGSWQRGWTWRKRIEMKCGMIDNIYDKTICTFSIN